MTNDYYSMHPIGVVHSCFKEKFGIPRQAGLVKTPGATIELLSPYNREEALQGLEDYSHIWLVFVFHRARQTPWKPMVRPPRFGGNKKQGVFATRSPFRPNGIGMSAVIYNGYIRHKGKLYLRVDGIDILDQTPVIDIKPYLPYADCVDHAIAAQCSAPPEKKFDVVFTPEVEKTLQQYEHQWQIDLIATIRALLAMDPRPAYTSGEAHENKRYGMQLYALDIKWQIEKNTVTVVAVDLAGTH